MAWQDLEKYYFNVKKSYNTVLNILAEFDKQHKEGLLEDKEFKKMKKQVESIRATYDPIAYFFMLWSKPDEKEKELSEAWAKDHEDNYNYLKDRCEDKIIKKNDHVLKDIKAFLESRKK